MARPIRCSSCAPRRERPRSPWWSTTARPTRERARRTSRTLTTTVICDAAPTNQVAAAWVELTGPNGSNGLTGNVAIARAVTEATAARRSEPLSDHHDQRRCTGADEPARGRHDEPRPALGEHTPCQAGAVPGQRVRISAALGRDQRRGRRPVAAAAEGESDQDRRHRRHGLPPAEWQRHAELQRPGPERHRYAVPVRGRRCSGRGAESGPGASRRRLRLPR